MSTLLGYRIFVAVVESGTVTQAAHQLNYTAPAISKQVTQLEASLKVQLFFRSHKSLTLTPEGKVFYQKCKDILALVAQAEDEILQEQDAVSGKIQSPCQNLSPDPLCSITLPIFNHGTQRSILISISATPLKTFTKSNLISHFVWAS